MHMELILDGINYFAQKEKFYGLDDREKELRAELREEYLRLFRMAFSDQIEHVKVVDPEGTDVTPAKMKAIQRGKQIHGRHLEAKESSIVSADPSVVDLVAKAQAFLDACDEQADVEAEVEKLDVEADEDC
ncbi:DUF896 domain-containing protein [Fundicoccus culcitae]|uniref:UPF0291 protein NRE15_06670 n=1 Tax=Fundicoccus culcitae TaxID=2969821 RepID=A0ABY5P9A1_9LACT|nr:DUF896 domain-containing protein [Fundicoccus culcitae]UUX35322.1 DUF896 domain-containing protein [Fundicoccus culcitae]